MRIDDLWDWIIVKMIAKAMLIQKKEATMCEFYKS